MEVVANPVIIIYEDERFFSSKKFNRLFHAMKSKGLEIQRYSFEQNREHFIINKDVWCLVYCAGREMLPATYVDGHIMKIEEYPTKKEINAWLKKS